MQDLVFRLGYVIKHGRNKTTFKQVMKNLKGDKCNDWSE